MGNDMVGSGMVPSSALIDVHLHGFGRYDTRTDSAEEILGIADMVGAEGVDEVVLSLYPGPIPVMRNHLSAIGKAMDVQASRQFSKGDISASLPAALHPARIIGVHLEGPFLNPEHCGALDAHTFVSPSWRLYRELTEGFESIIRSVTIAPELDGALRLIRQIARSGPIVSMGHSDASYAEAEAGFHSGAMGITHIFNGMRLFHHRSPGISVFGLSCPDIYVEVIADPYHLHLETIRLLLAVKPQNRILIVSDAVKGNEKSAADRQARQITKSGKLKGGSMSIAESSARLIALGFDEAVVMKAVTENPFRYLNS